MSPPAEEKEGEPKERVDTFFSFRFFFLPLFLVPPPPPLLFLPRCCFTSSRENCIIYIPFLVCCLVVGAPPFSSFIVLLFFLVSRRCNGCVMPIRNLTTLFIASHGSFAHSMLVLPEEQGECWMRALAQGTQIKRKIERRWKGKEGEVFHKTLSMSHLALPLFRSHLSLSCNSLLGQDFEFPATFCFPFSFPFACSFAVCFLFGCFLFFPSRAVFQVYPECASQMEMMTGRALAAGFSGGWVIDFPNSTRAKK